jgi:Uma2 family endonuclease
MNAITRNIDQAGDSDRDGELRPHRFSVQDMHAMLAVGILEEGAREELVEGELIEMPADGPGHNRLNNAIFHWLAASTKPGEYTILPNATLVLGPENAPSPDWCISPASVEFDSIRGPDTLLVIEQSSSSLGRDLGWKAALYARHGVRDYWVIDVTKREVYVHREPAEGGYGLRKRFAAHEAVEALLIPRLVLQLDRLG